MATTGGATTVGLPDLRGRIERSLSWGETRLVGECRHPWIGTTFVAFDLCAFDEDRPHVVRVTLAGHALTRVRDHIRARSHVDLAECLTDGRMVAVVGRLGVNKSSVVGLRAHQLFIDDMSAVGEIRAMLDALPSRLDALGIAADRMDPTSRTGRLSAPRPLSHVTVVSGESSQARGDFERALRREAGNEAAQPELHHISCPMQGSGVASGIIEALDAIDTAGTDAVCLVRGGGSWSDLWPFHSVALAHAVRTLAVPVYTGIGHSSDRSAVDCAADWAADTPSALGAAIGAAVSTVSTVSSGRAPVDQRSVARRAVARAPAAARPPEPLRRALEQEKQARRHAEAELVRARAELQRQAQYAETMRREAVDRGVQMGARSARHRATELAFAVTILATLVIGGLAVAVDEIVFALVGLAGLALAGRLVVIWMRTAPDWPDAPQSGSASRQG